MCGWRGVMTPGLAVRQRLRAPAGAPGDPPAWPYAHARRGRSRRVRSLSIVGDRDRPTGCRRRRVRSTSAGGCVLPGFTDAHVHFPTWAPARARCGFEDARSLAEALDRVAARARCPARGGWLRGLGWRAAGWRRRRARPRAARPRRARACRWRCCSSDDHSLWLSSAAAPGAGRAARVAGRRRRARRPRRADRHPAREGGLAVLRTLRRARRSTSTCRGDARRRRRSPTAARRHGDARQGRLARRARAVRSGCASEGGLTLRVWQSLPARAARRAGARSACAPGLGDDLLRVGYVKALHGRHARLAHRAAAGRLGRRDHDREALAEVVRRAAAAGLPVAVHAIGDAANRDALDAFEATRDAWEPRGLRQRIEHAQLLDAGRRRRFAALGVTASVQFSHAPVGPRPGRARVGGARRPRLRVRALLDAGARLVNGSDAPVEELDPLAGLRAASRARSTSGRRGIPSRP